MKRNYSAPMMRVCDLEEEKSVLTSGDDSFNDLSGGHEGTEFEEWD